MYRSRADCPIITSCFMSPCCWCCCYCCCCCCVLLLSLVGYLQQRAHSGLALSWRPRRCWSTRWGTHPSAAAERGTRYHDTLRRAGGRGTGRRARCKMSILYNIALYLDFFFADQPVHRQFPCFVLLHCRTIVQVLHAGAWHQVLYPG